MKYLLRIGILFILTACTASTEVKIPEHVLSKEAMAKVMVDVHLLEASMNLNAYNPQMVSTNMNVVDFNADVMKKNGITRQQYDESLGFYSRNPRLLAEVYDLVLNELSRMQAEAANEK